MYVYKVATRIMRVGDTEPTWFDTLIQAENDIEAVKAGRTWVQTLAATLSTVSSTDLHVWQATERDGKPVCFVRVSVENACHATFDKGVLVNNDEGGKHIVTFDLKVENGKLGDDPIFCGFPRPDIFNYFYHEQVEDEGQTYLFLGHPYKVTLDEADVASDYFAEFATSLEIDPDDLEGEDHEVQTAFVIGFLQAMREFDVRIEIPDA